MLLSKFIFRNTSWFSPFKIMADVDKVRVEVYGALTEVIELMKYTPHYERISHLFRSFILNGNMFTIGFKFGEEGLRSLHLRKVDEDYEKFEDKDYVFIDRIEFRNQDDLERFTETIINKWL